MRKIFILMALCLAFTASVAAQEACPQDKVCISREAALKAVENADRVKALEAEIKVKDQALADQKQVTNDIKIEFARASGEISILKQRAVSDAAMIELMTKLVRPKKIGLINF